MTKLIRFITGLYISSISSDDYEEESIINPAPYTFAIWGVILPWQAAWMIYILTTFCRRNKYGPVFLNPPVVTPFFLMSFILNIWLSIMWTFLFDRRLLVWSFICLFLMFLTADIALVTNHVTVDKYGKQLQKDHR